MKRLALIFLAMCICTTSSAFACSNVLYGSRLIRQSDLIFKGEVIQSDYVRGRGYNAYSDFNVINEYKGKGEDIVRIYYITGITDLGVPVPKEGGAYLVFARKDKKTNQYTFYGCSYNYISITSLKEQGGANNSTLDTLNALMKAYPKSRDEDFERWIRERRNEKTKHIFRGLFEIIGGIF